MKEAKDIVGEATNQLVQVVSRTDSGSGLPLLEAATRIKKALREPFPPEAIKSRSGGGNRNYDYVPAYIIIHRLNDACEFGWNWTIQEVRVEKEPSGDTLVTVWGVLEVPPLGYRSGTGVQKVNARGGEDLVKGASSDALKKAATLFGVAIDLYGTDYEDENFAHQTDNHPPQRAQSSAQTYSQNGQGQSRSGQNGGKPEQVSNQCFDCGKSLTPAQAALSMRNYNCALCPMCQRDHEKVTNNH
jgi:hypothetical protein